MIISREHGSREGGRTKTLRIILAIVIVLIACVLFIFLGFHVWDISKAIYAGAKTLKPEVYVPLTITMVTAILGLTATLIAQNRLRKRETDAAFRERKIAIYLEFLEAMESLFIAAKPELGGKPVDQSELVIKLMKVRTKAVLWGSQGVLRALSDFTKVGENRELIEMFEVIERIQKEMRKDLGLSNRGLETHFFSKLVLSDPAEFDALKKNKKD
ncbi:hypothetical protein [Celeribacter baekdonensis]|uniref:Uncharacterized protein n=1 Tax=Celeribacter baekdonensis B30 TaxID=1208323 RepID=K2JXQ4_9RHOB|nr:hypothetical protein [Celeribacter baekdonensis]EKE70045.1 hypothetical protein B30_14199 [Celeribacter baekdonensis B30]